MKHSKYNINGFIAQTDPKLPQNIVYALKHGLETKIPAAGRVFRVN